MDKDPIIGVQHLASTIVRHFRLPDARMIVSFRELDHAGQVELASGPEYFIELHARYRNRPADIAAVLAHEVAHVFLHRSGLRFADTLENEILTDTVAAYLGAGWLILNAYKVSSTSIEKIGYLTPEEFGYVLGKRAIAFREDMASWFTGAAARAFEDGLETARNDHRRAPLIDADPRARRRYRKECRLARKLTALQSIRRFSLSFDDYRFDGPGIVRVTFECPRCHQKVRLSATGRMTARCTLCGASFRCEV